MFLNNIIKKHNYKIDLLLGDISLHSGIPKKYYYLKNKNFGDWEIPPWELFIFKNRLLGEGSFGKVYLAKWRETFVVAKVINKDMCDNEKDLVLREFNNMTKLHHPNIVQFLGYIDDPFIIVMEFIPKGNLMTNISSLKRRQKKNIMRDILLGLAYIHNRKPYSLIHRDIKPTNILLTNSKVAKICDFGLSKFYNLHKISSHQNLENLEKENFNELTGNVGTDRYMAPEIDIKTDNIYDSSYNNKVDIYSCGILLYEMFENRIYIPNNKLKWFYTPKKIRNIIKNYMLSHNPTDRLDALSLLKIIN